MKNPLFASLGLAVAALCYSLLLTPAIRNLSLRLGLVDEPDNIRKFHTRKIPRVGGIAVILSYLLAFITLLMTPGFRENPLVELPGKWWLLAALSVVFATGLVDDLLALLPKHKMAGQVLASLLAWLGGIQIHLFHGMSLDVWVSLPVTVIWLLVCANAFNLIDGLDGLAAGAGLFATLTIIGAALLDHNLALILITVPLAGCLLGFLRYNFNPASIFLGDCGSLTIGFLLGSFGVLWSQKISTFLGLSAPLMAMSLPLVDTSLAVARRFLRNRPIFSGDRGHIHHRLLDRGKSPRQTTLVLYVVCGAAALLSLAQQQLHRQLGALVILIFCGVVWAGVHYLGYLEFGFARRFFATGTLFRLIDDQIRLHALESSLREAGSEHEALDLIRRTCHELGFTEVLVARTNADEPSFFSGRSPCQVSIPFGSGRVLLLGGLTGTGRPLALPQLATLLANDHEQRIWQAQRLAEVIEIPLLEPFGKVAEVSVANQ